MKTLKDFANKSEFFQYLASNKKEIIDFKKASIKFTSPFGINELQIKANKSLSTNYKDDVESGIIKRTVIGNTYNWMDDQSDVLLDGCSAKTITERKDKIWHLHDHIQQTEAKVGKPTSIYEKTVDWTDLGIDKVGTTQALFMDTNIIKDFNANIFGQYLTKEINQHSIGLRYSIIDLAINDPQQKDEFYQWNKHIDKIGNKADVMEQGFFFAVKEIILIEISCVLAGSNELTPTLNNGKTSKQVQPMMCTDEDCAENGIEVDADEDDKCEKCGGDMQPFKSSKVSYFAKFARI